MSAYYLYGNASGGRNEDGVALTLELTSSYLRHLYCYIAFAGAESSAYSRHASYSGYASYWYSAFYRWLGVRVGALLLGGGLRLFPFTTMLVFLLCFDVLYNSRHYHFTPTGRISTALLLRLRCALRSTCEEWAPTWLLEADRGEPALSRMRQRRRSMSLAMRLPIRPKSNPRTQGLQLPIPRESNR